MPTALDPAAQQTLADDLLAAFETGTPIAPPSERHPDLTPETAYAVQGRLVAGHAERGRRVVGHKIGLTSLAMQRQLGIDSPDFGVILDSHAFASGTTLSRGEHRMILPKLEPELAFVLDRPLKGDRLDDAEVLAAVREVIPVIEIIDSRVEDWRIGLADTIADNASCFGVVVGASVPLDAIGPLPDVEVRLSRGTETLQTGRGDAVLGDPIRAVRWLAAAVGELPADQPILAGSFTAAVDAQDGLYVADFGPAIGTVIVGMEA